MILVIMYLGGSWFVHEHHINYQGWFTNSIWKCHDRSLWFSLVSFVKKGIMALNRAWRFPPPFPSYSCNTAILYYHGTDCHLRVNGCSDSQGIPHIVWNPKVCLQEPTFGLYHDASHTLYVRSIFILSFELCLDLASGLFRIPNHNTVCISVLPHMCHMLCPSSPPLMWSPNNILWGYRSYSCSICSLL
jgi:hypothetical protein